MQQQDKIYQERAIWATTTIKRHIHNITLRDKA